MPKLEGVNNGINRAWSLSDEVAYYIKVKWQYTYIKTQ